jgi:glucose/arabinose dehydrogenase
MPQTTVASKALSPEKARAIRLQVYVLTVVIFLSALAGAYLVAAGALPDQFDLRLGERVSGLTAPEGYTIRVFAKDLAAPRYLVAHPSEAVLFVGERGSGRVLALRDENADFIAEKPVVVAQNLSAPSGLAYYAEEGQEWLYIAQAGSVVRVLLDASAGYVGGEPEIIIPDLPVGRNLNEEESNLYALLIHAGELYVSINASCLACTESDARRGTVMVYALDGSNERVFARGLYQTLALAVNPITGQVWAGVQGRPQMPEDAPESLYALQNGDDAGFPRCVAGEMVAPEFEATTCEGVLSPLLTFAPQGNVSGLLFYAPAPDQLEALVTLHGGVNKEEVQVGLGVLRFPLEASTGQPQTSKPQGFLSGFWRSEEPGDHIGRPFMLAQGADGALYLSDDASGAVYQLRRDDSN